jgi:flagellar basal-body rod protein FlgC
MTFSMMDIGRSGVGFSSYWMHTIAHNLANVNTVNGPGEQPFRARLVAARAVDGGVMVSGVREDAGDPARVLDPGNPLADEEGIVTMPVVDLAAQMTDLILANRSYQLNLKTVETGKEAYQAALRIGQRS